MAAPAARLLNVPHTFARHRIAQGMDGPAYEAAFTAAMLSFVASWKSRVTIARLSVAVAGIIPRKIKKHRFNTCKTQVLETVLIRSVARLITCRHLFS
jgi:hypothetical protein